MLVNKYVSCWVYILLFIIIDATGSIARCQNQRRSVNRPNVIFIYTDDQGRGTLSYENAQKIIHTPNIDNLAHNGMRFENNYGSMFCTPARASLLTGYTDLRKDKFFLNRAGIYVNYLEGKLTLPQVDHFLDSIRRGEDPGIVLPQVFKKAGYVTGEIGKLEWGFATSRQQMKAHEWDYYYGYLDHRMCHGFYPEVMFENGEAIRIAGNIRHDSFVDSATFKNGPVYPQFAENLFIKKAKSFILKNKDHPFFLFYPTNLPHGPVSVPEIDPEFAGNNALTHDQKMYASMVKMVDDNVGAFRRLLDSLGLSKNTLIIFSSDNGHHLYYEGRHLKVDNINQGFVSDSGGDIFNGNDSLTGLKTTNWEGGVRVPLIYYWPGVIAKGSVSRVVTANYDLLSTMADLLQVKVKEHKDGISYLPLLMGEPFTKRHDFIAFSSMSGPALVTRDGWKLRTYLKKNKRIFQLYYLPDDYRERKDLASVYPDRLTHLKKLLYQQCAGDWDNGVFDFDKLPRSEMSEVYEESLKR